MFTSFKRIIIYLLKVFMSKYSRLDNTKWETDITEFYIVKFEL